jgi:hypothetical protein
VRFSRGFVIWSLIRGGGARVDTAAEAGARSSYPPAAGRALRAGAAGLVAVVSVVASLAAAVGRAAEQRLGVGEELAMEFTKEDRETVSAAIREAEKRTRGQIVCVLARSSSDLLYISILWASVLSLIVPWPLIDFTQWSVQRIFLLQLLVFILAGFVFSWVPTSSALVPRSTARSSASSSTPPVRRSRGNAHPQSLWHSHFRIDS